MLNLANFTLSQKDRADLLFALLTTCLRATLFSVSLSLAISMRPTSIVSRSMSMSSIAITTSTIIIKTKTTGASGEVRNS
jgi:hypothetical protein